MATEESRVTQTGLLPLPEEIRERLGLGLGTRVEWHEEGGKVYIRRAGGHSSQSIHDAVFATPPPSRTPKEMDRGIAEKIRSRHARG